jgi:hypothetical protein
MKPFFPLFIFATLLFFSCGKHLASPLPPGKSPLTGDTASGTSLYVEWHLSYTALSGFWNFWNFVRADSPVILGLNSNGSYYTKLNGQIVAQSTYPLTKDSISPLAIDTNYYFNQFKTTGMLSTYHGTLSFNGGDSLYLMDALITPEGENFSVFYR